MKAIFLVAVFSMSTAVPLVQDEIDAILYRPINVSAGTFVKTNLDELNQRIEANASDVRVYFYSSNNPDDGVNVDLTDAAAVAATSFSPSKPTVFVTQGWLLTYQAQISQDLKNALLKKHDVNVFIIDWHQISKLDYLTVFSTISSIGEIIGSLIMSLKKNNQLSLKTTSIIGHSYGAHIAGITGRALNGEISFIVATTLNGEEPPSIPQVIVETAPGVYSIENSTGPIPDYEVNENDVKFFFASRQNMNRIQVDARDPNSISSTSFSPNRDTWFVVHGWKNDFSSNMEALVGNAVLEKADANVFCVDWSNIARKTYAEAFAAVPGVGRITGELIKVLMDHHGLQLDRVHLVGHSLGAHVAGRIGADLGGRASLIVGLDPAGPMFFTEITSNRLDPTDAQYVHVIHTCAAILGFRKPLGHADYYPNGGEFQNSCPADVTGSCSHSRSYMYYAESVITGRFLAKSCGSHDDYKKGKCNGNPASEMGGYSPDRRASGTYYLDTNNKAPYAMG